jgi:hypothetical protein
MDNPPTEKPNALVVFTREQQAVFERQRAEVAPWMLWSITEGFKLRPPYTPGRFMAMLVGREGVTRRLPRLEEMLDPAPIMSRLVRQGVMHSGFIALRDRGAHKTLSVEAGILKFDYLFGNYQVDVKPILPKFFIRQHAGPPRITICSTRRPSNTPVPRTSSRRSRK